MELQCLLTKPAYLLNCWKLACNVHARPLQQPLTTGRSALEKLAIADDLEMELPLCQDRGAICLTHVLQRPSKQQVSLGECRRAL